MKLERQFALAAWDDDAASTVVEYLRSRGFANVEVSSVDGAPLVLARRGSWWGNLTSFDMTKVRAEIRVGGAEAGTVGVELEVQTFAQEITQWNAAVWRLELVELQRVLCGRGRLGDVWSRFNRDRKFASLRWVLSGMTHGKRLSQGWEAELKDLEAAATAP